MGVTGLWRLVEPAGKPVPVETLENKVLAIDISIWLHQMVKGYQDARGAPLPNAHLIGLFQRLCKLLYFRIRPVFVFDGGFPDLKRETIAKRQDNKNKYHSESARLQRELALLLSKQTAVNSLLGKQISPKKGNKIDVNDDDLFKLPAIPQREDSEESESEDETSSGSIIDLHSVDVESNDFKSLPVKEKYDLLVELKETRKMNSWGKIHELPKKSENFSDFQMERLLKRRKVQECLQETEKEMGDAGMSLNDLESLLNEEGIDTKIDYLHTKRIASNNTTRYLLINDVKQALAEARKKKDDESAPSTSNLEPNAAEDGEKLIKKDEYEEDLEMAIKMSMECVNEGDTNVGTSKTDDSWTSFVSDTDYSDSDDEVEVPDLSSAKAYIMQYSDLTNAAINNITHKVAKHKSKAKSKRPDVNQIINELNNEKTIIDDYINLSSSDEDEPHSSTGDEFQNKSSLEMNSSENCNDNLDNESTDITQSSIICLGKVDQETITVDSSFEGVTQHEDPKTQATNDSTDTDSDANDLEEVPEESDAAKPVVELVLDDCNEVPEDDIFADIFESTQNPPSKVLAPNILKSDEKYFQNISDESAAAKPVQLVLKDCNEAPEDDIFADIFENTQKSSSEVIPPNKVMSPKAQNMQDTEIRKTETIERSTISSSKFQCPKGKNAVNESTIFKQKQSKVTENIQSEVDNPVNTQRETTSNETLLNKSLENDNDSIKATNSKSPDQNEIKQVENNKQSTNETIRPIVAPISEEQLNTMAEELQVEEQDLMQQKGRVDRIGRNITDQMTKEAQELLQIFGIPYVVAPMEAEAQCAFLESVKLTDGTITDDSDIWLFGGRTVYKNFFNQKKHVLQFLSERIERSFNLSREQLVLLALLVGSDYTTGVAGVGPVTALEILASFPFNKKGYQNENSKPSRYTQVITGLQEFKKWTRTGKRTDNTTLKKKLRNVNVGDDFPSVRVVQAYLDPNVEKSEENFTWGDLDITVLRDYTRAKFGWSQNKLDEIINPVLKRLKDRKTQKTVEDYFKKKIDIQALQDQMSKRVKAAVHKMETGSEIPQEEKPAKGGRKRKAANNKLKETDNVKAGPSNAKQIKNNDEANVLKSLGVKVVSHMEDDKSTFQIDIPKSDRVQEIIPQREKDKQCLLQNKMKAIELFRKTKIDKKKKPTKRRPNLPKAEAELSESSDSN